MTVISSFKIFFEVERDIIVPPYTSKVSRSIILKFLEKRGLTSIVNEIEKARKLKPYVFSTVFHGEKPLYKTASSSGKPLVLKSNVDYWFKITIIGDEKAFKIVNGVLKEGEIGIYNTTVKIVGLEANVTKFEELGFESEKIENIHVKFLTPTLLQMPKIKKVKLKTKLRHVLFPIPSLIIYSLGKHWNIHAPEKTRIPNLEKLAKIADYTLVEVDYNIKPVTAIYDEKRRPRGFIGWTLYKWNPTEHKKYNKNILKLLNYANHIGIGRSRTSGFGTTQITPK